MNALEWEINLLSKMVEVDTESVSKKGYDKCASIIIEAAKRNSLATDVINGEEGAKDGCSRPNVIVTLDTGSEATLLIEAHFDIVPPGPNWKYPPFKLTLEKDKAYGRGTADNKAGIAAALGAMRLLRHEKLDINLKLIAGVDEEIGGQYGLDYVLTDRKLKGDAALIVDAGADCLYLGACGIIWGKVTVEGKQGHAGSPYKAKNAIEEAIRLFTALDPYRKTVEKKKSVLHAPPDAPQKFVWGRYTVTMFHGGEKENVIPGTCEFRFDRRLLPEESPDQAEKELKTYFKRALQKANCRGKLEITNKQPGYHTSRNLAFVQAVARNIKKTIGKNLPFAGELGGNDGSFFAKNGIPVVSYGTIGTDTRYHSTDEFVYLKHIENVRDLIVNLGKIKKEEIAQ